jgi:uracil-DNA glycosylase
MSGTMKQALDEFCARGESRGWSGLPFFRDGAALAVAERIDAALDQGIEILPPLPQVFSALVETPLERVKVVILGQDPYPTPGDAHGLAFSYTGLRRQPASLKAILAEAAQDIGFPLPRTGDLTPWARSGVLLLNTALTTQAGRTGAHLKLGWARLADEVVAAVSRERSAAVFMLWGAPACARAELVDRERHLVLCCGHPSPLNRKRDFNGCGHFSQANAWLIEKGESPIDWRIG